MESTDLSVNEGVGQNVKGSQGDTLFVSVESPYNAFTPWGHWRNVQYAILANKHAGFVDNATTYVPHLTDTQYVKFGWNSYVGDSVGVLVKYMFPRLAKYDVGREETIDKTNNIRRTKVNKLVYYTDFGVSAGMQSGIDAAKNAGVPVEERKLPKDMMKDIFGQSVLSTVLPIGKIIGVTGLSGYGLLNLLKKYR